MTEHDATLGPLDEHGLPLPKAKPTPSPYDIPRKDSLLFKEVDGLPPLRIQADYEEKLYPLETLNNKEIQRPRYEFTREFEPKDYEWMRKHVLPEKERTAPMRDSVSSRYGYGSRRDDFGDADDFTSTVENVDGVDIRVTTQNLWVYIMSEHTPRTASVMRASLTHDFFCFNGRVDGGDPVLFERKDECAWSHAEAVEKAKRWVANGRPVV